MVELVEGALGAEDGGACGCVDVCEERWAVRCAD